jgi:hypothetical protein
MMAVAMAASAAADNDLARFDAAMQGVLQGPLSQTEQDQLIALLLQAEEEDHFNMHMDEEQYASAASASASASASATAQLGSRTCTSHFGRILYVFLPFFTWF